MRFKHWNNFMTPGYSILLNINCIANILHELRPDYLLVSFFIYRQDHIYNEWYYVWSMIKAVDVCMYDIQYDFVPHYQKTQRIQDLEVAVNYIAPLFFLAPWKVWDLLEAWQAISLRWIIRLNTSGITWVSATAAEHSKCEIILRPKDCNIT